MASINLATAAGLLIQLSSRIRDALASRQETIEVDDLGMRAQEVNDRIQAARGGQG